MVKLGLSKKLLVASTALLFAFGCQCQMNNNSPKAPEDKASSPCQDDSCPSKSCDTGSCSSSQQEPAAPASKEAETTLAVPESKVEPAEPVAATPASATETPSETAAALPEPQIEAEATFDMTSELKEIKEELDSLSVFEFEPSALETADLAEPALP